MDTRSPAVERRLGAYYRITENQALSLEEKIQGLLRLARASYRMPAAVLAQITGERFEIKAAAPTHGPFKVGGVLALPDTNCAETIVTDHPIAFASVIGTPRETSRCFKRFGIQAYLGMRIVVSGSPWGTVSVSGRQSRPIPFTDGDRYFLRLIADWIGNALTWSVETQELRSLAEWRNAVFSSIRSGILTCDAEGTVTDINPAAQTMFGYAATDLIGHHSASLLIGEGPALALMPLTIRAAQASGTSPDSAANGSGRHVTRLVEAQSHPSAMEALCRCKDGRRFPAMIQASTLYDRDGKLSAYVLLVEDLTERLARLAADHRARATELATTILRGLGDAVVVVDSLLPHRIRLMNASAERMLSLREADAVGQEFCDIVRLYHSDGATLLQMDDCIAGDEPAHQDAFVDIKGAVPFPVTVGVTQIESGDDDEDAGLSVITLRDMSEHKAALERLRLSDKVFENSAEAILITDAEGTILTVNPAFSWITGYSAEDAVGNSPNILKSGRHTEEFYRAMWYALLSTGHWEGEIWDRHKAGHLYPKWLTINAVREDGRVTHFVALFSDISARKEQEERIRFLAEHDQLTGLPNRHFLKQHFGVLKISERSRDRHMALMMIDLDQFKQVNDSLGHAAGDELLVEVARRLVATVRDSDIVVRLGGDEFVVLLEDIHDHRHAARIADKMIQAVAQPVALLGKLVGTSPSIGIALGPEDGEDIESLLRKADIAMYRVKVAGRNGWQFFAPPRENS